METRTRTHDEIRRHGGVGNLNEGVEIVVHGLATRLIAWPGNGFQTASVHVVTHRPGEASDRHAYALGEEAAVCLHGRGEVWLHGRWVAVEPGDVAFWPAGVEHATRNRPGAGDDFVLVTQLTPPPLHLYEPAGFYDRGAGAMRFPVIERARRTATPGTLPDRCELRASDGEADVRAWNLGVERIRARGALFSLFRGAPFDALGPQSLLVLWPGHGADGAGLLFAPVDPGNPIRRHAHPVADECVIFWDGDHADLELDGRPVRMRRHDVLLVPAGVEHGGGPTAEQGRIWLGSIAAPPQLDLLLRSGYCDGAAVATPPWSELAVRPPAACATSTR